MRPTPALRVAQTGHLATFALLLAWYGFISPSERLPTAFVLLVLVGPLLLPLRGLLYGRRYTVAWSLFLALGYFTHAIVELYSTPSDRLLAAGELFAVLLWFIGGIAYVRATRQTVKGEASPEGRGS